MTNETTQTQTQTLIEQINKSEAVTKATASQTLIEKALKKAIDKPNADEEVQIQAVKGMEMDLHGAKLGVTLAKIAVIEKMMQSHTDPATLAELSTLWDQFSDEADEAQSATFDAEATAQSATEEANGNQLLAVKKARRQLEGEAKKARLTLRHYCATEFLVEAVAQRASSGAPDRAFLAIAQSVDVAPVAQVIVNEARQAVLYDLTKARVDLSEYGVRHIGESGKLPTAIVEPLPDNHPGMLRALEAILSVQPNEAGQSASMVLLTQLMQGAGPVALTADGYFDPASSLALCDDTVRELYERRRTAMTPAPKAKSISRAVTGIIGTAQVPEGDIWADVESLKARIASKKSKTVAKTVEVRKPSWSAL